MNWISVKEKLPDKNKVHLAVHVFLGIGTLHFDVNPSQWRFFISLGDGRMHESGIHKISHWLELPEPPEIKDE